MSSATRTALCLYGLTGGAKGKDGAGPSLDVLTPFEHYKRHILAHQDVDVFIHSWSVSQAAALERIYQPESAIYEQQIRFSEDFRKQIVHSRWYSQQKALQLMASYEVANNFQYDLVMVSRLDLLWFTDVIFKDYDPTFFYASHWNNNGPNKLGPYDRDNYAEGRGFLDFWFFSGSANMDKFGCLYDYLGGLAHIPTSSHLLARAWADKLHLPIKYVFWRGFDHELYRRWKRPGWRVK